MMRPGGLERGRRGARTAAAGLVAAIILAAFGIAASGAARAMTFACIESSRYVVLAAPFGGDLRALAEAIGTEPGRVPPPDACRAAYATGRVVAGDNDRLLAMIAQNQGWLDTLYLGSPGGSVDAGLRSALIVRAFWLATKVMPPGRTFTYQLGRQAIPPGWGARGEPPPTAGGAVPDLGPGPNPGPNPGPGSAPRGAAGAASGSVRADGSAEGRATGQGAQAPAASVPPPVAPPTTVEAAFCASACTHIFAAGADREGIARVHRCGMDGGSVRGVSGGLDSCLSKIKALYARMGAGDALIGLFTSTSRETTTPVTMPRFPATVEDALIVRCKSDAAQLDDLAALARAGIHQARTVEEFFSVAPLAASLEKVEARRRDVEGCVTRARESDRLAAFARLCGRGCTSESLAPVIDARMRELER